MSYFSTQLKAALEQVDESREAFADRAGVSYSILTNMVNARRAPDKDTVEAIALALPREAASDLLLALWCDICPDKVRDLVHLIPNQAGDSSLHEAPQASYSARSGQPQIDTELQAALDAIRAAAIKHPAWRSAVISWSKTAAE